MGVFSRKKDQPDSFQQSPPRQSGARTQASDKQQRTDPIEMDKRRARRRLVGAVAIAVGAVVFLPMIFDSEPKGPAPALSVQMPDKDSPFTPGLPGQDAASTTGTGAGGNSGASSAPAGSGVPGVAGVPSSAPGTATSAAGQLTPPSPGASPPATNNPAAAAPVSAAPASPAVSVSPVPPSSVASVPNPMSAATSAPTPPAATSGTGVTAAGAKPHGAPPADREATPRGAPRAPEKDDPRAIAALEGKTSDPTPSKGGAASGTGNFAVQIGAFASAEKVKELRDKLAANGLKTYTETLNTAQGERTRVRVGPYASHEAAEKARERIKGFGLDGAVIPL